MSKTLFIILFFAGFFAGLAGGLTIGFNISSKAVSATLNEVVTSQKSLEEKVLIIKDSESTPTTEPEPVLGQ